MGRPKKNQAGPEARQRLIDAYWELLEEADLTPLTVSAISTRANCNRGTFYYHFSDMDALVTSAIEEELFNEGGVPNRLFDLVAGLDDGALFWESGDRTMHRLSLVVKNTEGIDFTESKLKVILMDMWQTLLCPDGSALSDSVRAIIEYASSGVLGLLMYKIRMEAQGEDFGVPRDFPHEAASFFLSQICKAQKISEEEILVRLKMCNQIMRTTRNERSSTA